MRVVFMGTPDFAVTALERLIANGYELAAVFTQPDRVAGRGRFQLPPPVKKSALKHGLHIMQPVKLRDGETIAGIAGLRPDVIVVAAYGQILPQAVLDIPRMGCVNIHPSLLPRYRGVSPVPSAILNGDNFAGISVMLMDRGLDTGPVLCQAQISISSRDTAGSLMGKLSLAGSELLLEALPRLSQGALVPRPQDESLATYSNLLNKEDGEIDWNLPAVDIWRRVRAYQPWPGCYTRWQGRQLKVVEAIPIGEQLAAEVGRVTTLDRKDAAFGITTGEGNLGIIRVQIEGKRAMPAAEFLRGQRDWAGMVLPSD